MHAPRWLWAVVSWSIGATLTGAAAAEAGGGVAGANATPPRTAVAMAPAAPRADLALDARLQLGANFNEFLHTAQAEPLAVARVGWVRGFLPALDFIDGRRELGADAGLAAFRAAAARGQRVALTLKWNFLQRQERVPTPESAREQACFAFALAAARQGRPDVFLLINEYFPDTMPEDTLPDAQGKIPMVVFLQRLTAHVAAAGLRDPRGAPLPLACGGFTRVDLPRMQQHPSLRVLLPWLATAPELAYVNFHLHQQSLDQYAVALGYMRQHVPTKPFIVTEFSLVWVFRAHLEDALGASPTGRAFAQRHGLAPEMTVRAYVNAAMAQRVPEAQWHAFLNSQPWYDPEFLRQSCDLMERHGVTLATYAFLSESSGAQRPLRAGDTPWRLNPIYAERFAVSPDPQRPAVNPDFFAAFRARQR